MNLLAFLAHALFLIAAWTLVIKYAFPIAYAHWEGVELSRYVMLDFWWVVHIWLGCVLLRWRRYTYMLAMVTSVVEIAIVVTKLVLFLADPSWTIWTASWFVNKCFVLAVFSLMLGYFLASGSTLRAQAVRSDSAALDKAIVHRSSSS